MTDAIERAARAMCLIAGADPDAQAWMPKSTNPREDRPGHMWEAYAKSARAAILAFLDAPELVEAMTVQMEAAEWSDAAEEAVVASQRDGPAYNRFLATSAVAALRAAAGGE